MIKDFPITINGTAIPFPDSWEEVPNKIANNFGTESGGRKQIVIRNSRLRVAGSWTVSSRWLKNFLQWRDTNTLTVRIYDARTDGYVSRTMGIIEDSFQYTLIRDSKLARNTNGLYRLSFEIEEF